MVSVPGGDRPGLGALQPHVMGSVLIWEYRRQQILAGQALASGN